MDVVKAVRHASQRQISLFVGLSDEGLAVPGGSFLREEDAHLVTMIEQFNQTQDYTLLTSIEQII